MVDLFVGLVLGNMVAGVIGNRTDALFCQCWQTIYERLRQGGPPVNHDLQRAIRKAIFQATLCLLSDALRERGVNVQSLISRLLHSLRLRLPFGQLKNEESRWLWRVYNELSAELSRVSSAEDVPPSPVAENELALLLRPQGVTAEKRAKELQERVTDEWLRELRELSASKQFGEPPEVFVRRLREGWQPPEATERFFWFDLVCAFFAHEVKHNQVVANIVMAKLLADLPVDEQHLRDALTDYLERKFAPILQRLDDIKQQLDELERQQREGFEELKERQAEIIAILLTVRASLSEVAQWVRLIAESMAEIPVAKDLNRETRRFLQDKWREGFVGRKEAMERLNRFVATNPNGVAIVYAPAGYGKTTFLAHWIRQVEETGGWLSEDGETVVEVVSHFFNQAVDSSALRPSNAYAHLLAQLVLFSDQPIRIRFRISEDDWRADLRNFLADSLKLPEGVKLVIVLDGLDDAEGKVEPFIPDKIPEGLFVVVSGRWDWDGEGESPPYDELPPYFKKWAKFTEFISLKALSEEELREWLRTAGDGELAQFAENDDFVRMLREKTDGFPLFVRYLMDDLLQAVKEGKSPEQVLERTPKGFSEYVKEQWERLTNLVQNDKVRDLFALLTVAKGALRQDEVEELTGLSEGDLENLPHQHQVTRWFSIGESLSSADLPTYSFAHPLLAKEFRDYLNKKGKRVRRMEERLLEWCANWREHPSFPYILRHYAEHLYEKCPMTNERMTNEQMTNYAELCRLALDSDFKQAQTQHLPDEPNLPLKTVQLALDAAIQLEDAPMMARLLIEHAKRAQSEETPLQAWRRGHRDRALELATDIVFKRDHKLGTLWSLLLAWVAESEGEREWAKRFLDEIRKRWEGEKLEKLRDWDWQGEMAAFLLGELGQVEGAVEVAGLVLDDESERKLAASLASKELFDQALKVAEGIEEAWERARALIAIAGEMAKARMFDQALKVAEGIEKADERARALREIAGGMAKAGVQDEALWRDALKVAEGIEKADERARALREIAGGMAKAGVQDEALWRDALKVAEGIEKADERARALIAIAGGMAKARMFDQALKVAEGIEEARQRAWALREIAGEMAKAGMFDQALKVAEGIEKADERARALREIAGEMAKAGMEDWAKEVFEQALKVAEGIEKADERAWALREIAGEMAKAGMFDQALKVAEGIEKADERARALREIAGEMAKAGMEDWAKEVFEQALKVAEGIEKAWLRAWALREIAGEMAKAGMEDWAKEVFEQALKVAEGIEKADERAWALIAIAGEMAKAGVQDEALWRDALKVAEGIEDAEKRAWALIAIAGEMAKAGMEDWAKEVFEQALKVAEGIEKADERARALREIAGEMAKAGMEDWAKEVFEQALKVAEGIEKAWLRAWALREIAGEMAKAGMFDQALKVAEGIEKADERARALREIAEGMAKAGVQDEALWRDALKVAEGIEKADERARALREIAEGMAKAGMEDWAKEVFEQALKVAEGIEKAWERAWALREIAEEMAKAGMFEQALKVAEGIEEARQRAWALREIAGEMAKAGMEDWAKEVFEQALKVAEGIEKADERAWALIAIAGEMAKAGVQDEALWRDALKVAEGIEKAWERAWALREIAGEMAKAGMFDQALKVAEGIEEARQRAWALGEIAGGMAKAGMEDWAKEVFEQALKVAEGIEKAWLRAWALREIAGEMAKAGMEDWAKEVFEQALKVAEGIEKAWERAWALREIAEGMAKAGVQDEALWRDALKVAEGIEKAEKRARALREIAEGMAKAGMEDWAKEVFEQALKVAEGIEKAWERAWALREIAGEMAKAGMFEQALKVAEGIEKAWLRARALREIAEGMAKAGMEDWAKEVFEQALKVAEGIEKAWERAWALREIAGEMAKAGMFDQALKVAEGIEEAWQRAWALGEIAGGMAKAGEVEGAVSIVEREMAVRTEGLPSVLRALAERAKQGDGRSKEGFLRLLPLCGWSLEFAYRACRLLAWLYPERGEEIAGVVRGE